MPVEIHPASFPNEESALEWGRHLDSRYEVVDVVPSKDAPGRVNLRLRTGGKKKSEDG